MTRPIKALVLFTLITALFAACNEEPLSPKTNTAAGGGTLTSFMAYAINSTASTVSGRVVFWKDSENKTLVQISLKNTLKDVMHPVSLMKGAIGNEAEVSMSFYDVSGTTGEFGESKFYVISDPTFYSSLKTMDVHVNVFLSAQDKTIVAAGNIGKNADPVQSN